MNRQYQPVTRTSLFLLGIFFGIGNVCAQKTESDPKSKSLTKEQQLHQETFAAFATYETARSRQPEILYAIRVAKRIYSEQPQQSPSDIFSRLNDQFGEFEKLRREAYGRGESFGPSKISSGLINVVKAHPKTSPHAKFWLTMADELGKVFNVDKLLEEKSAKNTFFWSSQHTEWRTLLDRRNNPENWREIWQFAQQNEKFRKALDVFLKIRLNLRTSDSAESILFNNPDFRDGHYTLKQIVLAKKATQEQLKKLAKEQTALFSKQFKKLGGDLKKFLEQQQKGEEIQRQKHLEAREYAAKQATIHLVTSFMRIFGDDSTVKLATQLERLATIGLEIEKTFREFMVEPDFLGGLIFSGNILNAAFKIVSLFSSQPSVEQLILDQLKMLRKELLEMRKEMRAYFQAIDAKLDTIYFEMLGQFQVIYEILAKQHRTVEQIQQDLASVHTTLLNIDSRFGQFESNLYHYLADGFNRVQKSKIKECVEYALRYEGKIDFARWQRCLDSFVNRAMVHSRDSLSIGPPPQFPRDASNQVAYRRLSQGHLTKHLDYLARLAQFRFGNSDLIQGQTKIPDAVEWAVASTYFLHMLQMAPEFVEKLKEKDLTDLLREGEMILNTLRNIKTKSAPKGLIIRKDFINKLLENYKKERDALSQSLTRILNNFEEDHLGGIQRTIPLEKQQLRVTFPRSIVPKGVGKTLPMPGKLASLIPPEVAALLKLNPSLSLNWVFEVQWVNKKRENVDTMVIRPIKFREPRGFGVAQYYRWIEQKDKAQVGVTVKATLDKLGTVIHRKYTIPGVILIHRDLKSHPMNPNLAPGELKITMRRGDRILDRFKQEYPKAIFNNNVLAVSRPNERGKRADLSDTAKARWAMVTEAVEKSWTDVGVSTLPNVQKEVTKTIQDRLVALDQELNIVVLDIAEDKPLRRKLLRPADLQQLKEQLEALTGARSLLNAYLRLGMPRTLAGNAKLASRLLGEKPLVNLNSLSFELHRKRKKPISFRGLFDNKGLADQRFEAFKKTLSNTLQSKTEMGREQVSVEETFPLIEMTLARLHVTLEKMRAQKLVMKETP